jgi:hypothetical protein
MLVCESMEACISVCTCAKSSICCLSRPIPSTAFSLVKPTTDVLLQRSVLVRVPSRGGGSGSEARLGVTVRGVVTTTLMVTPVATPIPSVPLGLLRVSLWCSHGLLCCLHTSSPASARWSCEAMVYFSHSIKLQCKTFTRI